MHIIRSWRAHLIYITISKSSLKKFDLLLSTLEVKVFDRKEFFKSNNVLIITLFVIVTVPVIRHQVDQLHNSICYCTTQLHNQLYVHSIWKKNILTKTCPIPIKCLHGILRVAVTGILNQLRYFLKDHPVNNCWDWYFCNINSPVIFTTASHAKNWKSKAPAIITQSTLPPSMWPVERQVMFMTLFFFTAGAISKTDP